MTFESFALTLGLFGVIASGERLVWSRLDGDGSRRALDSALLMASLMPALAGSAAGGSFHVPTFVLLALASLTGLIAGASRRDEPPSGGTGASLRHPVVKPREPLRDEYSARAWVERRKGDFR